MPELLDRYSAAIQPYLGLFARNACIELTRVLCEVLARVGVTAEACEAQLVVKCDSKQVAYLCGFRKEDRLELNATGKITVGIVAEEGAHVVAQVQIDGQYYLVDSALAQASAPAHGLHIDRSIVAFGPLLKLEPGAALKVNAILEDDTPLDIHYYVVESRSFEQADAWDPSHLVNLIEFLSWKLQEVSCPK